MQMMSGTQYTHELPNLPVHQAYLKIYTGVSH